MTLDPPPPALLEALRASGLAVADRVSDRLAAAHDGSPYRLVPAAVVRARSAGDVATVVAEARASGSSVTFRSGGTSLSGQAGSTGVIVDTRRAFRQITILDDGVAVRTGPGATVRQVNARLARHGRKLGPDPASEIACTIGGVVANNSSGMACGIRDNAYRTLDSVELVLPSGTTVDTSDPQADSLLEAREPDIHAGLLRLRDRIRGNPASVATVRRLHSIKNTMGYALNSFLDHDSSVDILEHLIVGSEGTLAFVASATFRTVPIRPHAATGLLVFDDLQDATSALPAIVDMGFATVELLDTASLRVAQSDPGTTEELRALHLDAHAALLVEFQEASADDLRARRETAHASLARHALTVPVLIDTDPDRRARLWRIRKGLFTAVAGSRPSGTTALLEDVAVPVDQLYSLCTGLVALFSAHGYDDGVIFGHAKDGNIHFMITERFDEPRSMERYARFTDDVVDLVLRHGGTLKAEHGTGRMMAPFLPRQVGDELYDVMCEVKRLIDPSGVLNPGVLISDDPQAHLRNLKVAPQVEPEVDRCVECGYCEPACPSSDLTLTPRERIALRREAAQASEAQDLTLVRALEAEYRYDGVETCAVDGMCQTACPVLIHTGDLVRRLRQEAATPAAERIGRLAAAHWDTATRSASVALSVAGALPSGISTAMSEVGRATLGRDVVPRYSADLPAGGSRRMPIANTDPEAVYFSSCTTTMFAPEPSGLGVREAFLSLCERAGVALAAPPEIGDLCCGTPWKSKGLVSGYHAMRDRVALVLVEATDSGRIPVICDAASCSEGLELLLDAAHASGIRTIDAVAFTAERILPSLPVTEILGSLALHPTCSSTRMSLDDAVMKVAERVARRVDIADDWQCCAFAGDRGMLHPELTASATSAEAAEVMSRRYDAYASVNRTCEIALSRATGRPYRHLLEILEQVTR
ncbi:FAD-binding and (Fe-S)-binding domain-containing protein [Microbacterium sp. SSM24]|uniref:FAD-binding and (Fe-S)-binding domain-containing protein n=1 Tax=Microbacterium sp. SSM24 TaxID=2991714 RepID=UPI002226D910|nr:FAD-binding and (Fe-S)-binding domain-containing protein [Microbacterium sp. SSM24]MCW3492558.1 FAD-binding oxidoreductase [Microbacterium sp. SSM24]